MYIPAAFAVENPKEIRRIITSNPFTTLVTVSGGEPFASHIPLLLEEVKQKGGRVLQSRTILSGQAISRF